MEEEPCADLCLLRNHRWLICVWCRAAHASRGETRSSYSRHRQSLSPGEVKT